MYLISNQELRDLIRMLEALRDTLEVGKSLRRANMKRVAGLLIGQLERKPEVTPEQVKQLRDIQKNTSRCAQPTVNASVEHPPTQKPKGR